MEYTEDNLFDLPYITQADRVQNALTEIAKAILNMSKTFHFGDNKLDAMKNIINLLKKPESNNDMQNKKVMQK